MPGQELSLSSGMSRILAQDKCVLAIDPTNRSFAFVVMEGHDRLVDWGFKTPQIHSTAKDLSGVEELIQRYQPDVIALEDAHDKRSRRCTRVKQLVKRVYALGLRQNIPVRGFPRAAVTKAFGKDGAITKHQIATVIANRFPELAPYLPPHPRKVWEQETREMSLFNSMSFALMYFHNSKR